MADKALYIAGYRAPLASIVAGHGTAMCPVFKPEAAIGAGSVVGSRLHSLVAASTSAGSRVIQVLRGRAVTKPAAAGAMAFTATTITRTTGSFVTDGWRVGDRLAVIDPTVPGGGLATTANQRVAVVTGVAALTLTFAAATFTAEAIPVTAIIYRLAQQFGLTVSAGAGVTAGIQAANLLSTTNMPWVPNRPDTNMVFGPDDVLLAGVTVALSAGETIEVSGEAGDY